MIMEDTQTSIRTDNSHVDRDFKSAHSLLLGIDCDINVPAAVVLLRKCVEADHILACLWLSIWLRHSQTGKYNEANELMIKAAALGSVAAQIYVDPPSLVNDLLESYRALDPDGTDAVIQYLIHEASHWKDRRQIHQMVQVFRIWFAATDFFNPVACATADLLKVPLELRDPAAMMKMAAFLDQKPNAASIAVAELWLNEAVELGCWGAMVTQAKLSGTSLERRLYLLKRAAVEHGMKTAHADYAAHLLRSSSDNEDAVVTACYHFSQAGEYLRIRAVLYGLTSFLLNGTSKRDTVERIMAVSNFPPEDKIYPIICDYRRAGSSVLDRTVELQSVASHEEGDTAMLSDDVLGLIVSHLVTVNDKFRFAAVCKRWRSVVSDSSTCTRVFLEDKWRSSNYKTLCNGRYLTRIDCAADVSSFAGIPACRLWTFEICPNLAYLNTPVAAFDCSRVEMEPGSLTFPSLKVLRVDGWCDDLVESFATMTSLTCLIMGPATLDKYPPEDFIVPASLQYLFSSWRPSLPKVVATCPNMVFASFNSDEAVPDKLSSRFWNTVGEPMYWEHLVPMMKSLPPTVRNDVNARIDRNMSFFTYAVFNEASFETIQYMVDVCGADVNGRVSQTTTDPLEPSLQSAFTCADTVPHWHIIPSDPTPLLLAVTLRQDPGLAAYFLEKGAKLKNLDGLLRGFQSSRLWSSFEEVENKRKDFIAILGRLLSDPDIELDDVRLIFGENCYAITESYIAELFTVACKSWPKEEVVDLALAGWNPHFPNSLAKFLPLCDIDIKTYRFRGYPIHFFMLASGSFDSTLLPFLVQDCKCDLNILCEPTSIQNPLFYFYSWTKGCHLLHETMCVSGLPALKLLLEAGCRLDAVDGNGNTPLELLLSKSWKNQSVEESTKFCLPIIEYILSQSDAKQLLRFRDETVLHLTLRMGLPANIIEKFLICDPSLVSEPNVSGDMPLFILLEKCDTDERSPAWYPLVSDYLSLLVKYGVDLQAVDNDGCTFFYRFAFLPLVHRYPQAALFARLLDLGNVDVNERDKLNRSLFQANLPVETLMKLHVAGLKFPTEPEELLSLMGNFMMLKSIWNRKLVDEEGREDVTRWRTHTAGLHFSFYPGALSQMKTDPSNPYILLTDMRIRVGNWVVAQSNGKLQPLPGFRFKMYYFEVTVLGGEPSSIQIGFDNGDHRSCTSSVLSPEHTGVKDTSFIRYLGANGTVRFMPGVDSVYGASRRGPPLKLDDTLGCLYMPHLNQVVFTINGLPLLASPVAPLDQIRAAIASDSPNTRFRVNFGLEPFRYDQLWKLTGELPVFDYTDLDRFVSGAIVPATVDERLPQKYDSAGYVRDYILRHARSGGLGKNMSTVLGLSHSSHTTTSSQGSAHKHSLSTTLRPFGVIPVPSTSGVGVSSGASTDDSSFGSFSPASLPATTTQKPDKISLNPFQMTFSPTTPSPSVVASGLLSPAMNVSLPAATQSSFVFSPPPAPLSHNTLTQTPDNEQPHSSTSPPTVFPFTNPFIRTVVPSNEIPVSFGSPSALRFEETTTTLSFSTSATSEQLTALGSSTATSSFEFSPSTRSIPNSGFQPSSVSPQDTGNVPRGSSNSGKVKVRLSKRGHHQ